MLMPEISWIDENYAVQRSRSADYEALKLWYVWSWVVVRHEPKFSRRVKTNEFASNVEIFCSCRKLHILSLFPFFAYSMCSNSSSSSDSSRNIAFWLGLLIHLFSADLHQFRNCSSGSSSPERPYNLFKYHDSSELNPKSLPAERWLGSTAQYGTKKGEIRNKRKKKGSTRGDWEAWGASATLS